MHRAAPDSFARRSLVAGEVALAVVLLVGAALLLRSVIALSGVDTGLVTDSALAFDVQLPHASYPEFGQHDAFFSKVIDRIEAAAGVVAVGTTHILPLSGNFDSMGAYAADTEYVVVIYERLARELWPGKDAVGRQLRTWRQERLTLVGVVHDIKHLDLDEDPEAAMYVALAQGIMYWQGSRASRSAPTAIAFGSTFSPTDSRP